MSNLKYFLFHDVTTMIYAPMPLIFGDSVERLHCLMKRYYRFDGCH
jgi:hypothetical protein